MTEQDTIKLAQEMIDAHNAHDNGRLGATVTDDFIYKEFGTQRNVRGRQAWLDIWQGWRRSCTSSLRVIPPPSKPGIMALHHTTMRGHGHDSAPCLLPTRDSGAPVALRYLSFPLAKPSRAVTSAPSRTGT